MLAKLLVIGKMKDRALSARADEFLERCRAYGKAETVELPDSDIAREGKALLRELDREKSSCIIVLSEEGKLLTTEAFASYIAAADRKIVFVIGGPFGLAPEVKARASLLWSLSPLTFTHELARLLLCEQLYRALNLNAGGSYHHR